MAAHPVGHLSARELEEIMDVFDHDKHLELRDLQAPEHLREGLHQWRMHMQHHFETYGKERAVHLCIFKQWCEIAALQSRLLLHAYVPQQPVVEPLAKCRYAARDSQRCSRRLCTLCNGSARGVIVGACRQKARKIGVERAVLTCFVAHEPTQPRVVLLHGSNGSGRRRQLGPCFAVRGAESAIINSAIINSAIIISAIRAIVHSTSRCRRERRLQA
mmetsp:Transcript_85520/g.125155  ORF Transcript_85520/g.125155 Transcript_85520/m.125155 type:complete len:217 (-) Transcript_85520:233-883(-)